MSRYVSKTVDLPPKVVKLIRRALWAGRLLNLLDGLGYACPRVLYNWAWLRFWDRSDAIDRACVESDVVLVRRKAA